MTIFQRTPGTKCSLSFIFCAKLIDQNCAGMRIFFSKFCRYENILFKGENVLTPKTLQQVETVFFSGQEFIPNLASSSNCSKLFTDVPGPRGDADL